MRFPATLGTMNECNGSCELCERHLCDISVRERTYVEDQSNSFSKHFLLLCVPSIHLDPLLGYLQVWIRGIIDQEREFATT